MKNRYIYPTKKNMLRLFFVSQLLPCSVQFGAQRLFNLTEWLQFELVLLGCLSLWQLKPFNEMDEREKSVTYKWKSRMLDYTSTMILIPIICLSLNPGIEGWNVFIITALPIFSCYVLLTIFYKNEFGYFFTETRSPTVTTSG